jgi:hypothetical protein
MYTSLMTTLEMWCGIYKFFNNQGACCERSKIRKILLFITGLTHSRKLVGNKRSELNINYTADAFASVLNGQERRLEAVYQSNSNGTRIGDFSRQSA